MEVPRIWRESKTRITFGGRKIEGGEEKRDIFKYPGGEVSLHGSIEEVYSRFENKGFKAEAIEEVLFYLFGVVATEPTISFEKIVNSESELVGGEIGKKHGSEVKFGIDRLPRKISRRTLFSAGTNN